MISVYVAGSSAKRDRARAFMDRIAAHEAMCVSYNWVRDVDRAAAAGITDAELSNAERARYANADLDGVTRADVFVLLAEEQPTGRGMWVELGFVLALNDDAENVPECQIVVIVSGGGKRSIFTSPCGLADHEVDDDAEAFAILEDIAERCAR